MFQKKNNRQNLNTIILMFLFLLSINCKSQKNQYKNENLCNILKIMDEKDQQYRVLMSNLFFKIIDSIIKSDSLTMKDYAKLSRETQLDYGKRAKKIVSSRPRIIVKKSDSLLMLKQIKLDNKNTELLLDIVEKRGYPNKDNCECNIFPETVFRHSQPQYFERIRPLILKEYKAGRLNKFRYNFFLHHLNGRKKSERHLIKG